MGVTHVGRGVVLSVRVGEKEERGYNCGFQSKTACSEQKLSFVKLHEFVFSI